jgi:hypothetical protein
VLQGLAGIGLPGIFLFDPGYCGDSLSAVMKSRRKLLQVLAAGLCSLAAAILPLGSGPADDAAKAVTQRAEGFVPNKHGFAFRNIFKGSPLPAALRGASSGPMRAVGNELNSGLGLPTEFGLCGGMSLAAADFYLAKRPVPDLSKPPEQGTPLYEYIYQRQADSMGPLGIMALKFWTWTRLPDHSDTGDCTQKLTAAELPGIVKRLKTRQLVPIGLVLTNGNDGKLWQNHQILCYGVKECDRGVIELQVYDPNYPKDDKVVIKVTPVTMEAKADAKTTESTNDSAPSNAAKPADPAPTEYQCQRISGKGLVKKVRGLFSMPYEPKTPPEGLSTSATGK